MGRKYLGKIPRQWNVKQTTPAKIAEIAKDLGYQWAGKGSVGMLLDAIASLSEEDKGLLKSLLKKLLTPNS